MNRRATDSGDSLELLLDTICNMFGCIVFIAIMLSLFAGSGAESLARSAAGMSSEEALAAKSQTEDLERQLARSSEMLEQLQKGIPESERTRLASEAAVIATLEADIKLAESRLKDSAELEEQVASRKKTIDEKLADAKSRQDEDRTEQEKLKIEIEHQKSLRVGKTRLPVTRVAKNYDRELMIILQGGYAYAWRHSKRDQATMVQITEGGHRIKPILGRGVRVTETISSEPRWNSVLQQIDPQSQAAYIMVYPDSVHAFLLLRQDILRRRIPTKLEVIPAGEEVLLVPTPYTTTD